MELQLATFVDIDKIVIYNTNFKDTQIEQKSKSENISTNIHPIQIELRGLYNNLLQKCKTDKLGKISDQIDLTDIYIPDSVKYSDLDSIKNRGSSLHFQGWGKYDGDDYYCRFIEDITDSYTDGTYKLKLNCVNPSNPDKIIYSDIVGDDTNNKVGYLRNERNPENDTTDYCRCIKNKLKCSSIIREKSNNNNPKFENNLFKPNNSILMQNRCDNNNYKTSEALRNYDSYNYKLPETCRTTLLNINQNSIDASFYNSLNDRYYIFKNIRIDNEQFVLFCEVQLIYNKDEHDYSSKYKSIIDYTKYPQIMSSKYWPELPMTFNKHINTVFNGNLNDVYFVSGEKIARFDLTEWTFSLDSSENEYDITKVFKNTKNSSSKVSSNENSSNEELKNISYAYYRSNPSQNHTITYVINNKYYEINNSSGNVFEFNSERISNEQDSVNNIRSHLITNNNDSNVHVNINSILSFPDHQNVEFKNILFIFVNTELFIYDSLETKNKIKEQIPILSYYENLKWDLPMNIIKATPTPNI